MNFTNCFCLYVQTKHITWEHNESVCIRKWWMNEQFLTRNVLYLFMIWWILRKFINIHVLQNRNSFTIIQKSVKLSKKYFKIFIITSKTQTDHKWNDYKGLFFISTTQIDEVITFQTCRNIWKFPKNVIESENLP